MTPTKILALRNRHRLTRAEFGQLVYQTERAVYAWERGQRNIPQALWELLQYKLDGIEPPVPNWDNPRQGKLL